jgi:hypothetical protein
VAAVEAVWLESAPAAWGGLVASDVNATAAHRPGLWEAFAASRPGHTSRFLAVMESEALVGGALFVIERRAGFHWIHGAPMVLPGAPLATSGRHAEVDAAVAAALAALARSLAAVGGEWSLYRPEGPPVAAAALETPGGETRTLASAVIDLAAGSAAAWRRVERKTRQEITRARAQGVTVAEAPDALEEAYALHAAQSRRWRGHAPLALELSRRLLAAPADGGPPLARLFAARDRDGLLSAALALDHPRETLVWWSGTHPAGRERHAFALLLWAIAEWGAAAGRARLNLGASPGLGPVASFKQALGARAIAYPVRWLDARAASRAGRALAALQGLARRDRPRGDAA